MIKDGSQLDEAAPHMALGSAPVGTRTFAQRGSHGPMGDDESSVGIRLPPPPPPPDKEDDRFALTGPVLLGGSVAAVLLLASVSIWFWRAGSQHDTTPPQPAHAEAASLPEATVSEQSLFDFSSCPEVSTSGTDDPRFASQTLDALAALSAAGELSQADGLGALLHAACMGNRSTQYLAGALGETGVFEPEVRRRAMEELSEQGGQRP